MFNVQIQQNNAARAVINIAMTGGGGNNMFFLTGGQFQLTGTGLELGAAAAPEGVTTTKSLVTGYQDNIQGETNNRIYSQFIPWNIKTAIYSHGNTTGATKLHAVSGGDDVVIATYNGTGRIDYDPPLRGVDCTRADLAIEREDNPGSDATLYLVLVPESLY
jgi:hypothetical protein